MLNENDKEFLTREMSKMIDQKLDERIKPKSKLTLFAESWFKILTPAAIIAAIWFYANLTAKSDTRMFKDAQQREMVIGKVERLPNIITLDAIAKHATAPGVHMPREAKDSIYVTRNEYTDLIKGNAVDVYNLRREINKVLDGQDLQNKVLKSMEDKLDVIENKRRYQ